MTTHFSRRDFMAALSAGTATWTLASAVPASGVLRTESADDQLALLGGKPVRSKPFPSWPVIEENDRESWRQVLESRRWYRGDYVAEFDRSWAEALGARYSLATASGTSALASCMNALDIGPGDEVIVPPYTFVATVNVVLLQHALPIFVDTDRQTFQIDADRIEAAVTDRTRCILPVHLGGSVANMDTILDVSRRHSIPVVEDACQSHFAEWNGQKVGTLGDLGCFSFQASKNLNSAEGGAVVSNDGQLMALCTSFHNQGRGYRADDSGNVVVDRSSGSAYSRNGDNRRMTEFQAALLLQQLTRLERQARLREKNAGYLTRQLEEIDGITPARMYDGCTRNAYHLYMCRYDPEPFADLSRSRFLEALRAEGIPASGGYRPLNREQFLKTTFESRAFRKIYSESELREAEQRSECPENDQLCREAVWLSQSVFLGDRSDMDHIAAAIRKVQRHAPALAASAGDR